MVSVIMAVYNAYNYLEKAIYSILDQTYKDFELIIVNDGSDDGSDSIINRINDNRIRCINRNKNKGYAYTISEGLNYCKGKYVCFSDADDISVKDRLEYSVDYLEGHPECAAVSGMFQKIDENGVFLPNYSNYYYNPQFIKAMMMYMNIIPNGGICARTGEVKKVGITNEVNYGADYYLWFDILQTGNIHQVDKVMYYYRSSETNMTHSEKNERKFADMSIIYRHIRSSLGLKVSIEDEVFLDESLFYGSIMKWHEAERLFNILKDITKQAELLGLEYANEVKNASRHCFSGIMKRSKKIWD